MLTFNPGKAMIASSRNEAYNPWASQYYNGNKYSQLFVPVDKTMPVKILQIVREIFPGPD
jgi:hypothetical protein